MLNLATGADIEVKSERDIKVLSYTRHEMNKNGIFPNLKHMHGRSETCEGTKNIHHQEIGTNLMVIQLNKPRVDLFG